MKTALFPFCLSAVATAASVAIAHAASAAEASATRLAPDASASTVVVPLDVAAGLGE